MKATPKSCSCPHCKRGKSTKPGKLRLKHAERTFRHRSKQALDQGKEDLNPAPKAGFIS